MGSPLRFEQEVISDTQNIAVTYSGDGPTRDLLFFLSFPDATHVRTDVFTSLNLDPVAKGASGVALAGTGDYALGAAAGVPIASATGVFSHDAIAPGTGITNEVRPGVS